MGNTLMREEKTNITNPTDWTRVGSARLADLSPKGNVEFPVDMIEIPMGDKNRFQESGYIYALVMSDGTRLQLTGTSKARNNEGKYIMGNQVIPDNIGGLYILNLSQKEGLRNGFRVGGWKTIGMVAAVPVSGTPGQFSHPLQMRLDRLNPSVCEYRVLNSNRWINVKDQCFLRTGDIITPRKQTPNVMGYLVRLGQV